MGLSFVILRLSSRRVVESQKERVSSHPRMTCSLMFQVFFLQLSNELYTLLSSSDSVVLKH